MLQAVQKELSPLVLPLAPKAVRSSPGAIPFLTDAEGLGRRHIIASVASALSGYALPHGSLSPV